MHGEEETGTELFGHLNGFESLLRLLRRLGVLIAQQIAIRLMVRTTDASAQLVQLCNAKFVGAADQDGVGMRVVDTGFDNGRAQQQVVFLLREFLHHTFKLTLWQLAVANDDARFGQQ